MKTIISRRPYNYSWLCSKVNEKQQILPKFKSQTLFTANDKISIPKVSSLANSHHPEQNIEEIDVFISNVKVVTTATNAHYPEQDVEQSNVTIADVEVNTPIPLLCSSHLMLVVLNLTNQISSRQVVTSWRIRLVSRAALKPFSDLSFIRIRFYH